MPIFLHYVATKLIIKSFLKVKQLKRMDKIAKGSFMRKKVLISKLIEENL